MEITQHSMGNQAFLMIEIQPTRSRRGKSGSPGPSIVLTDLRNTVTQSLLDGGTPEAFHRVRSKAQSTTPLLTYLSPVAEASLLEESDMKECAQPQANLVGAPIMPREPTEHLQPCNQS